MKLGRSPRSRRAVPIALGLLSACGAAAAAPVHPETGATQEGKATWYSDALAGHPTASGEDYDPQALTAAHRTLPLGTRVRVTNLGNDRTVDVRINDRGPFGRADRIIDLSRAAAEALDMIDAGVVRVRLEVLEVP